MVMAPAVHAALLIFDPYWYLELLYTIAMVNIIDYIKIYTNFHSLQVFMPVKKMNILIRNK